MLNPQAVSLGRDTHAEVLWLQFLEGRSDGPRGEGSGAGILLRQEALVPETGSALELGGAPKMSSSAEVPDKTQGSGVVGSWGCMRKERGAVGDSVKKQ